jgi:PrgI family protein
MPSYQIPQFLDSGDKIFMGMNVRQFAYALLGFFICVLIFNLFFPAIGNYSFIIVAPVALLTAYISLGKYNGRDSEIYIFKSIIYVTKTRRMKYARDVDFSEMNFQLSQLRYEVKNKELENRLVSDKQILNDPLTEFKKTNSIGKTRTIKDLGRSLDNQFFNNAKEVVSKELKIQQHRELLDQLNKNKQK